MPFGLSGVPATFQRLMDEVLRGTQSFAGVYLDDIVIYSNTWENHMENSTKVLKEANLTLKLSKSALATENCTYLGH